ncbi:DeoR/GlpR family DNA-binding transcription regulator [Segnochrobactrum spirostomi]|uniref:DeoR/GlpR transcriptional regulator n=1 Tax=Segnochrobactrum spirostomi TaxID=2608987 RepID=A0A6A7Y7P9_9HYPH|nr:DeoR/GlpR family DNA-binding transcription regulator [Segnochrobactrum spirostomi]MQT15344.1 DeoR/GlpR transcriptional regulator [Segnochrobactrum spirostomi]
MKDDRLSAIRQHLYARGFCTIQDLADAVGASLATIRRDLQVLEDEGVITRSHGGARIASGADVEVAFEVRERQGLAAKRAIAAAAYDLLKPHGSIFLDAGTTVLQLARLLRMHPMPLTVFTNGLLIAQALMNVPKLKVSLLGGQLRNENASIVGPAAEAMLDRLWFDQLFLGASAVADDACVYSMDAAEASLNARMLTRSATAMLLADSSKFGRCTTFLVTEIAPPLGVISDEGLAASWRTRLADIGAPVIVAPLAGTNAAAKDDLADA